MSNRKDIPHLYKPLLPLAWLYSAGVWMRNKLFDRGILPVEEFSIPVISVGNLTVGGTGKTPIIEYLIELLLPHKRIAVLSRGYGRKSRGYIEASPSSNAQEIGDEPLQIYSKHPNIIVAVDSNRRRGIKNILKNHPEIEVILLDDAHQHRYVRPSLSIVLCDYNRPIYADHTLPAGRLREPMSGLRRADVVLLTKYPHELTTAELTHEANALHFDNQRLYASHIVYDTPYNIASHDSTPIETLVSKRNVIVFTGIANPRPMVEYIGCYTHNASVQSYPDHHNFTTQELKKLQQESEEKEAIIITTEKDAARLNAINLSTILRQRCYVLPMKHTIQTGNNRYTFDQVILKAAGAIE